MVKKSKYSDSSTLEYIYNIIKEGIWDWNAATGIVERSPGWFSMLGYECDCFEPNIFTWESLIHPDDYPGVMAIFDRYIAGKSSSYEAEYRIKKKDGTYLWILDYGKIVECNPDGTVARMIGSHLNIHEQKLAQDALKQQNKMLLEDNFNLENIVRERTLELEALNRWLRKQVEQSKHDANTDLLTSLYNRRKFEEELLREISRCKRYYSCMSLILLDADNFKKINDTYGHKQGDIALQTIAKIILQQIRASDIAARWGGEEFVLILPESKLDQAQVIAEKLRITIAEKLIDGQFGMSCSFGVTEFKRTDSLDRLLKRLDVALYDAKNAGRNCVKSRV